MRLSRQLFNGGVYCRRSTLPALSLLSEGVISVITFSDSWMVLNSKGTVEIKKKKTCIQASQETARHGRHHQASSTLPYQIDGRYICDHKTFLLRFLGSPEVNLANKGTWIPPRPACRWCLSRGGGTSVLPSVLAPPEHLYGLTITWRELGRRGLSDEGARCALGSF